MERFGNVEPNVLALLKSTTAIYSISEEDLYFKWESWSFKMGNDPELNYANVTLFKQDIQNQLEYSNQVRNKATPASTRKLPGKADFDDFLGGSITPSNKRIKREPLTSVKKKPESQLGKIGSSGHSKEAPPPMASIGTPFSQRSNAGKILETLNPDLPSTATTSSAPALTANFDPKKYSFRPMYQKLSEVAEVLDDQIDSFAEILVRHLELTDEDIGNPSATNQVETTVIGRIAIDSLSGGRLNADSVLLETSRRLGAGSRTKLNLSSVASYSFFPGQIVAFRGSNASGEFKVTEILELPMLPPAACRPGDIEEEGINLIVASGPYTTNDNLHYEALIALRDKVLEEKIDTVILLGPLVDIAHPLIRNGDFDCSGETLDDYFQETIAPILATLPSVLLVPHIRDAVSRHMCFPQEALTRSHTGLPRHVKLLPNPAMFSLREVTFGISTLDVLMHLSKEELANKPSGNMLTRLSSSVLRQRRFYPLFPGANGEDRPESSLDMGYAGLTEFNNTVPDIMILPSALQHFAKIVDGVVIVNPGHCSKAAASGTYAKICTQPLKKSADATEEFILSKVWERTKVEIIRI